jgi:hypothetical protein
MTMTKQATIDLYHDIAPDLFGQFDAEPLPFSIHEVSFYRDPESVDLIDIMFNSPGLSIADTHYAPIGTQNVILDPDTKPLLITFNPYFLPIVDEDEMWVILAHEIVHGTFIWEVNHDWRWETRARSVHEACALPFVNLRANRSGRHPFQKWLGDAVYNTPTLDKYPL